MSENTSIHKLPIDPVAPPFDPAAFNRRIAVDDVLRTAMIGLAIAAGLAALLMPDIGIVSGLIAPGIILALWLWWSASTAKAGRALAGVADVMAADPQHAEQLIQDAIRVRPVMRWARLLTYHRLAGLRHLQKRYQESAAISLCLLAQPLKGPAASVRPHLLLMLAEAQLELGNLPGSYHALAHLQQSRLSLTEALQRLSLQTRYELAASAYDAALHRSKAKVELAELMPAAHGATMHAMLATAAERTDQTRLANWLWQRAELLAPRDLYERLRQHRFGIAVVEYQDALANSTPSHPTDRS